MPSGLHWASIGNAVSPLHATSTRNIEATARIDGDATPNSLSKREHGLAVGRDFGGSHAIFTNVSRFAVIGLFVVACGGHSPPANDVNKGAGHDSAAPHAGSNAAGSTTGPVAMAPDVGCLAPSCVFHAGGGAYFTCLAGGAGACFHFGGPCAPADGCMYDPSTHDYKHCAHPVEGMCTQWGAACAPASGCMFDPASGLHHHCDEIAGGSCKRYGALCSP